jgi:hypothetical protein
VANPLLRKINWSNIRKPTRLNNNVSNAEKQAIKNFRNSEKGIVKSADKGGAIVIWPRESYIAETNKQLNDKRNYTYRNGPILTTGY